MKHRFFSETPITGGAAQLVGSEAHHAAHALRLQVGDEVLLVDGSGAEFAARVTGIRRQSVALEVLMRHQVDRELPFELTLGVALPKGDRQRWLVEKAVELGVTRLTPLVTQRSVARPVDRALARMRRTVVEASKQCGRTRLLEVAPPQSWNEYLATAPSEADRWLAHGGAGRWSPGVNPKEVYCAVGPEGGFTETEIAAASQAGWQLVGLGPRTLRVETAALALAACLSLAETKQ